MYIDRSQMDMIWMLHWTFTAVNLQVQFGEDLVPVYILGLQAPEKMVGVGFGGLTTEPEEMGQEPYKIYIYTYIYM